MRKNLLVIATLVFFALVQPAIAQNYFLKVDELTTNGSLADGYEDYVEINTKQFGVTNPRSINDPSQGRPIFQELIITKRSDKLSNSLLTAITRGTKLNNMEIVATARSGNGERVVINRIQLRDVYVTSILSSGVSGCENGCTGVEESYKFVFTRIKITTYSQTRSGAWIADAQPYMYNVESGRSEF